MKKTEGTEELKVPEKDSEKGLSDLAQRGKRKKILQNITLTTACLLIGIVIALQYRTIKESESYSSSAITAINDYQSKIISLSNEIDILKNDNEMLANKLALLEGGTNEEQLANLKREITQLRAFAGLTQVAGPGVHLTVNFPDTENIPKAAALIQMLVNEIKAADAQAMSINGERIVAMSEIRVVNAYVVINGKILTQPFDIQVIGDRKSLMSTLNMAGGVVSLLRSKYKAEIGITEEESVTINAFSGTMAGMKDILDRYNYEMFN